MSDHIMTVRQLIKYAGYELQFEIAAGHDGLDRALKTAESNRPGLALCGHYNHFGHERVQILGHGEMSYIESLPSSERTEVLQKFFSYALPWWLLQVAYQSRQNLSLLAIRQIYHLDDPIIICYLHNSVAAVPRR